MPKPNKDLIKHSPACQEAYRGFKASVKKLRDEKPKCPRCSVVMKLTKPGKVSEHNHVG